MNQPTALIACEYSGRVRDALTVMGFYAVSCDLLPSETEGEHIQGDVLDVLDWGWDLLIAHPPCTDLATSGARWFPAKIADGRQARALNFVRVLLDAPIRFKALENPKSVISSHIRKPDQIVQPWMFGHGETKETHFWLENLPPLMPTDIVDGRSPVVHHMAPGPDRWKNRSRTYQGIADAIADQWGRHVIDQLSSTAPRHCIHHPQQLSFGGLSA
ncbi:DNA cytosine methyltransferase [Pseudomonas peli]|uniref:DNA cytosine methyltransferase n=1 Tax=Pseudomonas peli TaxID=592361 RepID=UPI0028562392|nr:DNA cytosine methyltransferase [Pseudomonas peli]MDR7025932.1 site-specific DNA-cytosine methylase [Pseudomonas peli]